MTVREIAEVMEAWAPRAIAWEKDNVGLLIGSPSKTVRRIMVALDVTDAVVAEARKRSVDLLITHHPLMFNGIRKITDGDRDGRLIQALIHNNIALYAAHTNLDFTVNGVSSALARMIGLQETAVLHGENGRYTKIAVFVPATHAGSVAQAMMDAGAGQIGNYDSCSFRSKGQGTFRPLEGTTPFIGTHGKLESVDELRVELICPTWKTDSILHAMRATHPYEQPAYDLYALANSSQEYGAGIVGTLAIPVPFANFLTHLHSALNVPSLRYTGDVRKKISRVAVCGGSGADLISAAIRMGADAFVTADIRYHAFQDAEGMIALVDAGHFETESPIVHEIVSTVRAACRNRKKTVTVFAAQQSRNPVQYSVL